jgi:hypothetical protein
MSASVGNNALVRLKQIFPCIIIDFSKSFVFFNQKIGVFGCAQFALQFSLNNDKGGSFYLNFFGTAHYLNNIFEANL